MAIDVHELMIVVDNGARPFVGTCSCGWEARGALVDDVDDAFDLHCDAVFAAHCEQLGDGW